MDLTISIPGGSLALGNGVLIPSAPKDLTDDVAQALFIVSLPATHRAGGSLTYLVEVTDGTEQHVQRGQVEWVCWEKGGSMDGDTQQLIPAQKLSDSGELDVTFDWDFGTPGQATLTTTVHSTLASQTLNRIGYKVINDSQEAVVLS